MGLSRRNVLIGLGGIVAGGGALIGTGAFTTVQAERTVTVETTGDAAALLALIPTNSSELEGDVSTYANGAYAEQTDGTVEINLDADAQGVDNALNKNAITTIDNILYIVNNGTQPVEQLRFTLDVTGLGSADDNEAHENALEIVSGGASVPANGQNNLLAQGDVAGGDGELGPGENVPFGLRVNLLEGEGESDITDFDPNGDATITLTIEALTSSQS